MVSPGPAEGAGCGVRGAERGVQVVVFRGCVDITVTVSANTCGVWDGLTRLHVGAGRVAHTVDSLGDGGCERRLRGIRHGKEDHLHVGLRERQRRSRLVGGPGVDLGVRGRHGEDRAPLVGGAGIARARLPVVVSIISSEHGGGGERQHERSKRE